MIEMNAKLNPMTKHSVGVAYVDYENDTHFTVHVDNGYVIANINDVMVDVDDGSIIAKYRLQIIAGGLGMHVYIDDILTRECVYHWCLKLDAMSEMRHLRKS